MANGEMVNILNETGEVMGALTREEAERDNHVIESVVVFVFDSLGRVWVQLRPLTKKYWPGRWDVSAAGGVMSHENYQEAAHRETNEEAGIDPELQYIESFMHAFPDDNGGEQRRLSHLYIGISDAQPLPGDEVDEFKKWDPAELKERALAYPSEYVAPLVHQLNRAVSAWERLGLKGRHDTQADHLTDGMAD